MSTVVIAIVVLMIAGGAIAYIGDWIGFSMGKRRLSVFGLRPRHTARVFTVSAGIVIAVGTFVILLLLDHSFSVAVTEGAEILHRNHQLIGENRRLQSEADRARSDMQTAQTAAQTANQSRASAETKLGSVNTQLSQAAAKLTRVQAQLLVSKGKLDSANAQLAQARAIGKQLEASNELMLRNLKGLEGQIGPLAMENAGSSLVYRNLAELGRTVIATDQSTDATRKEIDSFLLQLSADALAHGASRGPNGHAVQVARVAIQTLPDSQNAHPKPAAHQQPQFADETQNIAALAEQIHSYSGAASSVVVIARALGNAFAGNQVTVVLRPFANRLAIKAGTVLGEITVDTKGHDPNDLLSSLQQLLIQKVRPAAIKAGVIPVVNPQLHEVQIGDVPVTDLYHVVDQVRQSQGLAVVTVSAAQDTYSADQLKLDFTVRPAASG